VRRVEEKVREINENNVLPDGIRIVPYYDRSDMVKASVSTVNKALLEGSLLVLIVLMLVCLLVATRLHESKLLTG